VYRCLLVHDVNAATQWIGKRLPLYDAVSFLQQVINQPASDPSHERHVVALAYLCPLEDGLIDMNTKS
jgi:hypothetical protein